MRESLRRDGVYRHGGFYATFKYPNLKTSAAQLKAGCQIRVAVDITNTGKRRGRRSGAVDDQHLKSKVDRPAKQLKGFQRITLAPHETRTVQIPVKAESLACWDQAMKG